MALFLFNTHMRYALNGLLFVVVYLLVHTDHFFEHVRSRISLALSLCNSIYRKRFLPFVCVQTEDLQFLQEYNVHWIMNC